MGGGTAWMPIDRAERDALILETVQLAVELGADVNASSVDGRKPLWTLPGRRKVRRRCCIPRIARSPVASR